METQENTGQAIQPIGQALIQQTTPQIEEAKAMVFAAFHMAMMKPRDVEQSRARIIDACKRPSFAANASYRKPVAGSYVTGPGIRFAEMALREWCNVLVKSPVVAESDTEIEIRVDIVDLENNVWHSTPVRVPKFIERKNTDGREVMGERSTRNGTLYQIRATEDEIRINTARAISFAKRNEGLRLIPADVIADALDVARATIAGEIKNDPKGAVRKILDAFGGLGITPAEIKKYLGHSLDTIDPSEVINLRSLYAAVRDGEISWSSVVIPDTGQDVSDLRGRVDDLAGTMGTDLPVGKQGPVNPEDASTTDFQVIKGTTCCIDGCKVRTLIKCAGCGKLFCAMHFDREMKMCMDCGTTKRQDQEADQAGQDEPEPTITDNPPHTGTVPMDSHTGAPDHNTLPGMEPGSAKSMQETLCCMCKEYKWVNPETMTCDDCQSKLGQI